MASLEHSLFVPREPAPKFLEALSEDQRRAVVHDGGPLVILAGPGAGKTRTIVSRVARLVAPVEAGGVGAEPESVLALAFTIKSAEELRGRLAAMVGAATAERVQAMTSHAFGYRIVRRFGDMIGVAGAREGRLADSALRKRLLRELVREHDLFAFERSRPMDSIVGDALEFLNACATDGIFPGDARGLVEKRRGLLDGDAHGLDGPALAKARVELRRREEQVRLYEIFERERLERGLITIDDCINLPIRILRECPDAAAILHGELRHAVIDEFQDWNRAQIELLSLLFPSRAGRAPDVCVVGDDDQAIFGFRGADTRAFERFKERWGGCTVALLGTNYRSAPCIVRAAGAVISRARTRFGAEKTLAEHEGWSHDLPASVEGCLLKNDELAGEAVATIIQADRAQDASKRPYGSYAVICRTGTDIDRVAAQLAVEGVPATVKRERAVLDDPAVQDLFRWCKVIVDPTLAHEPQHLLQRPPLLCATQDVADWAGEHRKGPRERCFLDTLRECAGRHPSVRRFFELLTELRKFSATNGAYATLHEIQRRCDLVHAEPLSPPARAERVASVVRLLRFAQEAEDRLDAPGDIAAFLAYFDDLSDDEKKLRGPGEDLLDAAPDADGAGSDAVQIMTAHKAKGLEFDTVFVVRCRPAGKASFPSTARDSSRVRLYVELGGEAQADNIDEERRLFYVACTRAKRRLVLLAEERKNESKSTDFFLELSKDDQQERPFPVRTFDEWRAAAEREAVEDDPSNEAPARPTSWMDGESARAKRRAAAIVLASESPAQTRETLDEAGAEQRAIARRLAMIAHLRRASGEGRPPTLPGFVSPDDSDYEAFREMVARVERGEAAARIVGPLSAPLELSFSRVKDYNGCARCFYAKYVLGLDEPGTSRLTVGNVIHKALEKFYAEWRARDADGVPLEGEAGLRRLLAVGHAELAKVAATRRSLPHDEAEDLRRQLEAQLGRLWTELHDPDAHILHIEQGVEFHITVRGAAHEMRAKIDRIDQMSDGSYRLIDYKTGSAREKLTDPPTDDLQMGIYLMALRAHFKLGPEEPVPGTAEYWLLESGERGVIDLAQIREDKVLKQITKAAEGMLDGEFERDARMCKGLCSVLGE